MAYWDLLARRQEEEQLKKKFGAFLPQIRFEFKGNSFEGRKYWLWLTALVKEWLRSEGETNDDLCRWFGVLVKNGGDSEMSHVYTKNGRESSCCISGFDGSKMENPCGYGKSIIFFKGKSTYDCTIEDVFNLAFYFAKFLDSKGVQYRVYLVDCQSRREVEKRPFI